MNKGTEKGIYISKYVFALVLPLCSVLVRGMTWRYLVTALASVSAVFFLTHILLRFRPWPAWVFNSCALLLNNAQYAVLFWSNTFVTAAMLKNLGSVEALSGKGLQYGITLALVIVFSLLPISSMEIGRRKLKYTAALCIACYAVVFLGGMYEEWSGASLLRMISQQVRSRRIAAEVAREMDGSNDFFREDVADCVEKPAQLTDRPNVILIFTEGLSQHIVEDERDIMPNLAALSRRSLVFENYFNHSFATYMGLSGQLHSGYQENNGDPNRLTALQDVFSAYGYDTVFLNSEPRNGEFTKYLDELGFGELITDMGRLDGVDDSISDRRLYELLLETALEKKESGRPFFLSMYSFGTHVSFDSVHEKYGDGKDPLLNRFYDLDVQIGSFLEAFEESGLAENTVLIVTADHATYCDSDFVRSFPDYSRLVMSLDRIPLYIYHRGMTPSVHDANGRNSLCLAPTVLDYLDMSAGNSFLGTSLFAPYEHRGPYDTVYESLGSLYNTEGAIIRGLDMEEQRDMEVVLARYFATKLADSSGLQNYMEKPRLIPCFDSETFTLKTELDNAGEWDALSYAIWSAEDWQDDLRWYRLESPGTGRVCYDIDMKAHPSSGTYHLHLYGHRGDESECLVMGEFIVPYEAHENRMWLELNCDEQLRCLETTVHNAGDWDALSYAVWSEKDGQDDLNWFHLHLPDAKLADFDIDLSDYTTGGRYFVHVYGARSGESVMLLDALFTRE